MSASTMNRVSEKELEDARRAVAALGNSLTPSMLEQTTALYAGLHDLEPPDDVAIIRDRVYGADERHRIDLFKSVSAASDTALLFVHGGGFVAGDKRKPGSPFYENIGIWAARNGFVGATMTYRLAPASPWPAGADDVVAAAAWLADNGSAYGIQNIILFGQSAGAAHVATAIALQEQKLASRGVVGAVLLSGVYDLTIANPNAVSKAYYGEDASLYAARSSQSALVAAKLPMLVGMAEYDPVHFQRQSMGLIQAISAARKVLPPLVQLLGHNHLSGVLHLGLPDDQLGLAIRLFAAGLKA
ncbi:alpha/beta hydrolase [Roseiarcaceae bacterium H3SJ34-1]|uniref:alpha/beta hydrolase n=1 Tax=Terripilifer ovatus TaxID=3032367 RepID=UPI003AB93CE2|nr:alpha/beta hydrolase [Roseiarcaceae bacterium H3SJ34-1]